MSYDKIMSQAKTHFVTNRYKVTEYHDEQLRSIEKRIGIAPSMVVRLALDILLPRLGNENIKDIDKQLERIFNE